MAYNLTHEEFRNGEQWNAFYYPSLELLTQSTLAAIWIYRLVLPAVVIVYPPRIVTAQILVTVIGGECGFDCGNQLRI